MISILGDTQTQLDEALSNLLLLDLIQAEPSSGPFFILIPMCDSVMKPVNKQHMEKK